METGDVAKAAGVSVATIRRWLSEGRIREPQRDAKGWRLWTLADVAACRKLIARLHKGPTA